MPVPTADHLLISRSLRHDLWSSLTLSLLVVGSLVATLGVCHLLTQLTIGNWDRSWTSPLSTLPTSVADEAEVHALTFSQVQSIPTPLPTLAIQELLSLEPTPQPAVDAASLIQPIEQLASNHQFAQALTALDQIPPNALHFEQAQQLRTEIEVAQRAEVPTTLAQQLSVPILMYHYISVPPDATDATRVDLSVDPLLFDQHLQYLTKQGYQTVTTEQLRLALLGQSQLPDKPIVLTFDDGYEDFYTQAFPRLQHHHLKATLFVISGLVGQPGYVTWPQLQTMVESGLVEIGSHTVDHADLPYVPNDQVVRELTQSKQVLESQLHIPITSFCYPYGGFSDQIVKDVSAAGYLLATTTQPGKLHDGHDLLRLTRVRIKNYPLSIYL